MQESEYRAPEPTVSDVVASPEQDPRMVDALKRLDAGVDALLADPSSYFRVMSRFHKYSLANMLMIFSQNPNATQVMGYGNKEGTTGWKSLGRQVKKGEHGIKIFYPKFCKQRDPDTDEDKQRLAGFGLGTVFDIAQTEGEPLPEQPPITYDTSTNDVSQAVNLKLSRYLIDQGVRMESVPMKGHAHGFYAPAENKIAIRLTTTVDPLSIGKTKTLAHEAAHFLANHNGATERNDAEAVAEASAFVALDHFGLDSGEYSFTYVAGWTEDRDRLQDNLETIRKVSGRIIRAVEGVGDPYDDEFGSWEDAGPGPISEKIYEMEALIDAQAPNL